MPTVERLFFSSMFALSITVGLFWLMSQLIVSGSIPRTPEKNISIVPYVHVHVTPEPVRTRRPKPKVTPPQPPPPRPDSRPEAGSDPGRVSFPSDPIDASPGAPRGRRHLRPTPADGNAVPLVRIEPTYPERALRRGIEGRVLIEFSISRSGAVMSPRIVASEPSSIFDEAALKAIRQWRYSPRIEKGVPVEQHGLRIAIPFRREGNGS